MSKPKFINPSIASALLAALLFGISTPLAKQLLGQIAPLMLAGLLYLGAGIGLLIGFALRHYNAGAQPLRETRLTGQDLPWLAGSVLSGGILGPFLLLLGLRNTPATSASLLLNLEGVLTALLAWFVFKEHYDRRIMLGMACIIAGSAALSWEGTPEFSIPWGSLAIAAACLCWAVDNNLTRKIAASDPVQIAAIKGLAAGLFNLTGASFAGIVVPDWTPMAIAGLLGFVSYGLSLMLFVLALRHIGTARSSAYFSLAPCIGAATAIVWLGEQPSFLFWFAATLMAIGICWLHLTEHHEHRHSHEAMAHAHRHAHDAHHLHAHDFSCDDSEPHSHHHLHKPLLHAHPHFPDIHHQHRHG